MNTIISDNTITITITPVGSWGSSDPKDQVGQLSIMAPSLKHSYISELPGSVFFSDNLDELLYSIKEGLLSVRKVN